ncbi:MULTISPECIES: PQQ-like beta-propeller repeat protein [unclassified Sphingomonas]|uniref:PQQ-like beta-propeller repeat protein n=1 Tax=unclassified Sphingomonas TaxID=196159 RepID=UPI0021514564|nr:MULTISPECIES: PQQ-like beta-propeller repeat protein [unclassified Sphingomonas]MCR5872146.1 PQQ-binding-like beta-propeller repeat protein [Sphingomonas sp. J344]UUX99541.1 PQQ-binding-like beta-propeller repeat protein [Sphingomonas sp. J315]
MMKAVRTSVALTALVALSACGIFKGGGNKTPVLGQRVPILAGESGITADKTIADVQVVLPMATVNPGWTQPGGNAAKAMGHLAFGQAPVRVWSARIAGTTGRVRLAAAPVVSDGKLFVVDTDAVVHAFDAATGGKLWSLATSSDKENRNAAFGGGVSVEGGRAFATNGLGDVVAIDVAAGTEVWRKKPGGPLRGAPTLFLGNAYVVSQDNQLFALAQTDGAVVWTQSGTPETQGVFGVAAPAAAQGTIVAGFSSGELNAYRYENGRALWSDTLSRSTISTSVSSLVDIDAEPVIDQGRVYAVGQGERMAAVELNSGQRIWEQNFAGISTPWVAGEWIFVMTDDARLVCIARGSGKIRWISQMRAWRDEKDKKGPINWVGPILAGDRLWLANTRGELVSASPADGSVGPMIELGDTISLAPVVANNMMYVLSDKGEITAYR